MVATPLIFSLRDKRLWPIVSAFLRPRRRVGYESWRLHWGGVRARSFSQCAMFLSWLLIYLCSLKLLFLVSELWDLVSDLQYLCLWVWFLNLYGFINFFSDVFRFQCEEPYLRIHHVWDLSQHGLLHCSPKSRHAHQLCEARVCWFCFSGESVCNFSMWKFCVTFRNMILWLILLLGVLCVLNKWSQ